MFKRTMALGLVMALLCVLTACSSSYDYSGSDYGDFSYDSYEGDTLDETMADYEFMTEGYYSFNPRPGGNETVIVKFSDLTDTSVSIEAYSHDLANYGSDDYDHEVTSASLTYNEEYRCYEFEYYGYWRLYSYDLAYVCYESHQHIGQGFASADKVNPDEVWWYEEAKRQTGNYGADAAMDLSSATVGDTITFGTYEMDNNTDNGADAIPWLVLDQNVDGLFVVSQYCLACQEPYEDFGTWETCEPRQWLNNTFYNTAFTAEEKAKILLTTVSNPDNAKVGTDGGNETQDYVFLLSIDEVNRYFPSEDDRLAYGTLYVQEQVDEGEEAMNWWLRSPGELSVDLVSESVNQSYVGGNAYVYEEGETTMVYNGGLRPAMWIAK